MTLRTPVAALFALSALVPPAAAFSPTPARAAVRAPARPLARAAVQLDARRRAQLPPGAKHALAALAAFALAAHPGDADAATRSGGRIGGRTSVSRSRPAPQMRAPRSSVNIHVAPPAVVAPLGGYGYGYGGYGGFYRPAPSIGFGFGGYPGGVYGYSPYSSPLGDAVGIAAMLARELERQALLSRQLEQARQIGRDQAQIRELQAALDAQNTKIEQLKADAPPQPAPAQ